MKYIEDGFRAIYHNFAILPFEGLDRSVLDGFPGAKAADGALVYGYYDREAGMTLEVLCAAKEGKNSWMFADGNDQVRSFIRIDTVLDVDFYTRGEPDPALFEKFKTKLDMLKVYDANKEIEETRTFAFLDDARHPEFIDDVMVYLEKGDLKPEPCWCRITGLGEKSIRASLLNEPVQAFGVHNGDEIKFRVQKITETGKYICFADL